MNTSPPSMIESLNFWEPLVEFFSLLPFTNCTSLARGPCERSTRALIEPCMHGFNHAREPCTLNFNLVMAFVCATLAPYESHMHWGYSLAREPRAHDIKTTQELPMCKDWPNLAFLGDKRVARRTISWQRNQWPKFDQEMTTFKEWDK